MRVEDRGAVFGPSRQHRHRARSRIKDVESTGESLERWLVGRRRKRREVRGPFPRVPRGAALWAALAGVGIGRDFQQRIAAAWTEVEAEQLADGGEAEPPGVMRLGDPREKKDAEGAAAER